MCLNWSLILLTHFSLDGHFSNFSYTILYLCATNCSSFPNKQQIWLVLYYVLIGTYYLWLLCITSKMFYCLLSLILQHRFMKLSESSHHFPCLFLVIRFCLSHRLYFWACFWWILFCFILLLFSNDESCKFTIYA